MKPIIIDMKDISDSVEVYESRPHPFFVIFIYFIFIMLAAGVGFMYFFHIDVKIKANGIFRLEDKSYEVSSQVAGKVITCNLEEGKYVSAGDVLVVMDDSETQNNHQNYQEQKEKVQERITLLEAYLKALDGDMEEFNSMSEYSCYQEYANRYEMLDKNMDSVTHTYDSQIESCQNTIDNLKSSEEYYESTRNKIQQASEAIKSRTNTFSETELYYYNLVENYLRSYQMTGENYEIAIKNLETEKQETEDSYQKLSMEREKTELEMTEEEKSEHDKLVKNFDDRIEAQKKEKDSALQKMELEQLANLEQQLNAADSNLISIRDNLTTAKNNLLNAQNETDEDKNQISLLNEKSSINGELVEYRAKLAEYENTIQSLEMNLGQYQLIAEQSGYVSMNGNITEGSFLGQGTILCEIVPEDKGEYYAEIYISNEDIGNIEEGDIVKMELNSYPASDYGYINGVIESLSKDIKVDNESGSAYYTAKVSCKNTSLVSKDGKEGKVKNGMMSQAGIITGERSVLSYVLEKINFLK